MTLKKRILLTVACIFVSFLLGGALAIFLVNRGAASMGSDAKAALAGQVSAVIAGVGCGVLWIPWAAEQGKKRREERERAFKAASRPKKRTRQS